MSVWASYFTQSCAIADRGAVDMWGERTTDTATTYPCLYRYQLTLVRKMDGEQITSTAQVWVGPDASVSAQQRVTLDATTYTVVRVVPEYEPDGTRGAWHLFLV
jgi:hypothetical protein